MGERGIKTGLENNLHTCRYWALLRSDLIGEPLDERVGMLAEELTKDQNLEGRE